MTMTSPGAELPDDIKSCQALIEQLRTKVHAATEQMAHLEELLARHQETIADQERTIENLAADNMLLKRALFGSRRERFAEDPAQRLLFEATTLDSPQTDVSVASMASGRFARRSDAVRLARAGERAAQYQPSREPSPDWST